MDPRYMTSYGLFAFPPRRLGIVKKWISSWLMDVLVSSDVCICAVGEDESS
jgi:hypothetical protein